MSWSAILLLAVAGAALLLLAVKVFAARRGDLTGPPKPKIKSFSHKELDEMTELVGLGEEAEVRRRLTNGGYGEKAQRRLIGLMRKVAAAD